MDGHLNGKSPNSSPPSSPPQPPQKEKCKRNKWTREEYKEVIYAYYYTLGRPSQERHTANSYSIWRTRNQDSRPYLDENKLANVRRDILRNNRLTDSEINAIKRATENDINIRHKGNEESDEQYSPPRGLIEILPSDQSTQRPEDTRNSIVPVKDSQENEKTTVTEDLAFAEEHRESMAEMRQKILNTLEVYENIILENHRCTMGQFIDTVAWRFNISSEIAEWSSSHTYKSYDGNSGSNFQKEDIASESTHRMFHIALHIIHAISDMKCCKKFHRFPVGVLITVRVQVKNEQDWKLSGVYQLLNVEYVICDCLLNE
ncbi:Hypothetical predicted protein [Octopus vulgaris]|uniref:Uncharacterized protein n=1 Tax=Octopus vulgaris TaxID=6645 RepID=A0AA36AQU3_OCTVU|nr:Hypothetical predicted protein [Octopus vulgaris]